MSRKAERKRVAVEGGLLRLADRIALRAHLVPQADEDETDFMRRMQKAARKLLKAKQLTLPEYNAITEFHNARFAALDAELDDAAKSMTR